MENRLVSTYSPNCRVPSNSNRYLIASQNRLQLANRERILALLHDVATHLKSLKGSRKQNDTELDDGPKQKKNNKAVEDDPNGPDPEKTLVDEDSCDTEDSVSLLSRPGPLADGLFDFFVKQHK